MKNIPGAGTIKLPFNSAKLKICIAQLTGPIPKGKIKVFSIDKDTYQWETKDEVEDRKLKIKSILSFIEQHHSDTNIIVFPEYTAPSFYLDKEYRELADKLNCMIIGSADNFWKGDKVYNQTPIYLPHAESPTWITKRFVSQWEDGHIDEPENTDNPVFHWQVEEKNYSISVYVGQDFHLSMNHDNNTLPVNGPSVIIVPTCAEDIIVFHNLAGSNLAQPGNRAVVLSNCIGGPFAGGSSIFLKTPKGNKFAPTFLLKEKKEIIAIAEVDCDKLGSPECVYPNSIYGSRQFSQYQIDKDQTEYIITEVSQTTDENKSQAIINPNLFEVFGKTMRMSFLIIDQYGKMDESKLKNSGIEIYSLLGSNDIMVTNLGVYIDSLISEITGLLPSWRMGSEEPKDHFVYSNFPYFEVKKFHKIHGAVVSAQANEAFYNAVPNEHELHDLLALSKNWNTNSISEEKKQQYLKKNWILESTETSQGEVDVIMTIRLTSPEMNKNTIRPHKYFADRMIPYLCDSAIVNSIYEGAEYKANINYLLRIKTRIEDLFHFLSEIHLRGLKENVLFATNTYLVVKKWSDLSLEQSLPPSEYSFLFEWYKEKFMFKKFGNIEDKLNFRRLDPTRQNEIVRKILKIQGFLDDPSFHVNQQVSADEKRQIMTNIIYGISFEDLNKLKQPHDMFLQPVEMLLSKIIRSISDADFNTLKEELSIKGKERNRLTLHEKISMTKKVISNNRPELKEKYDESCKNLYETLSTRNAFAHPENLKFTTIEACCKTMEYYADFFRTWDGEFLGA